MQHLPWIILFAPLVSAALIVLFTQRWKNLSALISIAAVLVSAAGSITLFRTLPDSTTAFQFPWLDFGALDIDFQVPIGITIDGLSKAMLLVVTAIGALIHIYSWAYMADDEGKSRYFAGLSFFMFSMLGIVFANNFLMMFIFWELVGVSSFILIGHWFFRNAPAAAANKAFICNRLGDFGFLLGILLVWTATQSVNFEAIKARLPELTANPAFLPFATAAVLCLFCGTVGKSAQFPLHVWLPDAMEGPTPVSALIHAATMVAAGVYMLARIYFIVETSPAAMEVIAVIGTITAVLAALMATQQDDIKRVLAYSTLSQLGYMVMAVGVASKDGAMFHLFTHAFFKALLFLGAGSVILACHHEQNIWKMGGLWKKQPITVLTFAVATCALMGVWGFSGFYSKDAILVAASEHHPWILGFGLFTAFLTAFYMTRLFVVVFFGKARTQEAGHAHEAPAVMWIPLVLLAIPAFVAGYPGVIANFLPTPAHEAASNVPYLASGLGLLGIALGFLLYRAQEKDPIRIPLLANKFYFDEFYAQVIWYTQDLLARISAFIDRWVLDTALVRGLSSGTWGFGFALRFAQSGNLQSYALLFGAGVVALFYFILFY
ncbi:MAG: NADH-quinone oxidoreductase subunit L [Chthoniobacteraceae bacterium]|nr:NADH-quinone oxidoreductase subunit L [Chthoniobacteraceae bacterium]